MPRYCEGIGIMPVVRKAVGEDIPGVLELWKELMDFHRDIDPMFTRSPRGVDNFLKHLMELLDGPDTALFVSEENGKLTGYLLATVNKYPPVFMKESYGMISDAVVTASRRRMGTGEALVNKASEWFREQGLTRVEMRLLNANMVSSSFWRKMGFQPYLTTLYKEL